MPHRSVIVVDADTYRYGGSEFKREYLANKKSQIAKDKESGIEIGLVTCSRCGGEIYQTYKYCPHCGAKFTDIEQLPIGIPGDA